MSLPTLTLREKLLYKDKFTAYTPVNSSIATPSLNGLLSNNVASWTIAPLSSTDNTLLTNIPCNNHRNPNFSRVQDPGVLSKEVNIFTSDEVTCQRQIQLQDGMLLFVTTRYGDTYWYRIDGAAEQEVLIPCTCVYVVPTNPPVLIT